MSKEQELIESVKRKLIQYPYGSCAGNIRFVLEKIDNPAYNKYCNYLLTIIKIWNDVDVKINPNIKLFQDSLNNPKFKEHYDFLSEQIEKWKVRVGPTFKLLIDKLGDTTYTNSHDWILSQIPNYIAE
jgi:hypothetical protein